MPPVRPRRYAYARSDSLLLFLPSPSPLLLTFTVVFRRPEFVSKLAEFLQALANRFFSALQNVALSAHEDALKALIELLYVALSSRPEVLAATQDLPINGILLAAKALDLKNEALARTLIFFIHGTLFGDIVDKVPPSLHPPSPSPIPSLSLLMRIRSLSGASSCA